MTRAYAHQLQSQQEQQPQGVDSDPVEVVLEMVARGMTATVEQPSVNDADNLVHVASVAVQLELLDDLDAPLTPTGVSGDEPTPLLIVDYDAWTLDSTSTTFGLNSAFQTDTATDDLATDVEEPPVGEISWQQQTSSLVEDIKAARRPAVDQLDADDDDDDDVAVVHRLSVVPLEESISPGQSDDEQKQNSYPVNDPTSMEVELVTSFHTTSLNTVDQQGVGIYQSSDQSTTLATDDLATDVVEPPVGEISWRQQTSSLVEDIEAARCPAVDQLDADDDDVAIVDHVPVDTSVSSRPLSVEFEEESISTEALGVQKDDDLDTHLIATGDSRDQPVLIDDFDANSTLQDSVSVPHDSAAGADQANSSSSLTQQSTVGLSSASPESGAAIDDLVEQSPVSDVLAPDSSVAVQVELRAEQHTQSAEMPCHQTSSLVEDIETARCPAVNQLDDDDDDVAVVDHLSESISPGQSESDDIAQENCDPVNDPVSMEVEVTSSDATSLNNVDQLGVGIDQSSDQSTTSALVGTDTPESTKR